MKTRVITGTVFTAVILLFMIPAFKLPWLPLILFTAVALLTTLELQQAISRRYAEPSLVVMELGALLYLVPVIIWRLYQNLRPGWRLLSKSQLPLDGYWQTDLMWLVGLSLTLFMLAALAWFLLSSLFTMLHRGPDSLPLALAENLSTFYIAFPLAMVPIYLFAVPQGYLWLFVAVFSPWISDVCCYFAGRFWGHTHILPQISPQKTLEGVIGGLLGTTLLGGLFFMIFMTGEAPLKAGRGTNFLFGMLAGLLLSLFAQFGDWFASAIKRYVKIKDFSHILPGHGGILDRFDSVLFTLPAGIILTLCYYLS
ncbi:MAG: phosphatidate cytidylyltransferase [Oscillospiraceae bacterium]|nr:phosphatidate cytidylyltransferase [Oscillospiraceae bacterium]MDD4368098.1 phosphatidate cytidylyltransferase [Oscillospiraceae bacterium]